MESICQYCNKQFTNKYTLNNHLKTAKTCILNRTNDQIINLEIKNFECNYCFKKFTRKNRLNYHYEICDEYKKNKTDIEIKKIKESYESQIKILKDLNQEQISQLQSQIKELQDKLANLCEKAIEKPTSIHPSIHLKNNNDHSVNNNTYNQLQALNLDPDHLYKVLDKSITYADIYGGQRTLAKVIKKEILTNEKGESLALCSDRARQMIKYKNMDNQIIKDPRAFNLISQIQPIINQIALKRKAEFEAEHFSSKESKEEDISPSSSSSEIDESEDEELSIHERFYKKFENKGYVSYSSSPSSEMEDEDEDEIIEKNIKQLKRTLTSPPNKKISPERLKEKENIIQRNMQKVIKKIEKKDEWPPEKKEYYLNLLIEGIQQYQILHINSNVFSKVLSMILPQENNLSLKGNQGEKKGNLNFEISKH